MRLHREGAPAVRQIGRRDLRDVSRALAGRDARIRHSPLVRVVTSARHTGRAAAGTGGTGPAWWMRLTTSAPSGGGATVSVTGISYLLNSRRREIIDEMKALTAHMEKKLF